MRRQSHTAFSLTTQQREIHAMYELAPDVYACATGRRYIFLDLKCDRYIAVPATQIHRCVPKIIGLHPGHHANDFPSVNDESSTDVAEELLQAGLLRHAAQLEGPQPPLPAAATRELEYSHRAQTDRRTQRHSLRAVWAMLRADIALRTIPLWRIAGRVRATKARPAPDLSDPPPWEVESITSSLLHIRPWYPRNYLCLYDSLALMLLLGSFRIRADWLFGVREDPFIAHCWVQHKSTVLNDHLDRIRSFVPIMVI